MLTIKKLHGSVGLKLVGLIVFLALFALPLHTHAQSEAPRVKNECSCLHNARHEFAVSPIQVVSVPSVFTIYRDSHPIFVYVSPVSAFFTIRAPPVL